MRCEIYCLLKYSDRYFHNWTSFPFMGSFVCSLELIQGPIGSIQLVVRKLLLLLQLSVREYFSSCTKAQFKWELINWQGNYSCAVIEVNEKNSWYSITYRSSLLFTEFLNLHFISSKGIVTKASIITRLRNLTPYVYVYWTHYISITPYIASS